MLVERLFKATVELQGFRVDKVTGDTTGLVVELTPDRRYKPRCGRCGEPARYRDTRRVRLFRHVPIWGISVSLQYAPRRVSCLRCSGVHVELMPWASGKQRMTRALMVTLAIIDITISIPKAFCTGIAACVICLRSSIVRCVDTWGSHTSGWEM